MKVRLTAILAALVLMAGAAPALAQVQTGEIFGRVTDNTGAVLPGVTVTLTSPVLLQPLSATSSDTGSYQFPRLPIGTYNVRFELPGFKTVVREGVRVEINFNAQVNQQLEISTVQETVTVSGESPVVDTKQTTTGATFTNEMLQGIPSARDPWVIIEQTPGISMDRQNVGGTASGQQSGYVSRGSSTGNNVWNIDGVVVTDQVATGASAIYYDFDAFEEMQISTGGNDVAVQTGGVGINLVTKSGTDRFKGSARYYLVDNKFQSVNVSDELQSLLGAGASGNPVKEITDYGIEAGGPIKRGRAWAWGSYGKQDIGVGILGFFEPGCSPASNAPKDITKCLKTDLTVLDNYNIKGQVQVFKNNKATWFSNYADKIRNARDASDLRPPETVFVQTGPVWTHKLSDQHIFSDRFMVDVQYAFVGGGFRLDFPEASLRDVQRSLEIVSPANLFGRSHSESIFNRPQDTLDITANYFMPGMLGGDHALKVGFRYRDTPTNSTSHIGGNTTARFRSGVASEVDLHRDSSTSYGLITTSLFAQDTFTRDKLTLNLGFRVDRQDDEARPSSVEAHPFAPEWLPAATFNGADSGVVWTDFSPRAAITYDVRGNGKTVAKGSYARYWGQMGPGSLASILNPVTAASVRFPWSDANGDRFVQRSEIDFTRILSSSGNYDPNNPTAVGTANRTDPNIKNDVTDEIIIGIDHELMRNFGVGANYIWRRYDNFLWDRLEGITSADYSPFSFTANCGSSVFPCDDPSYTVTYFRPNFTLPSLQIRSNVPDRWRGFNGVELTARKRFANNWLLNGSLAYNNAKDHWDSPAAFQDPTNIAQSHGAQYAPEQTGSGRSEVFNNAKWLVKISGMYSLPFGFNVSAFYNAHQGYPFLRAITTPDRGNRAGTATVLIDEIGTRRLNDVHLVDMKVEKWLSFRNTMRVALSLDVFNLTNSGEIQIQERRQNSSTANRPRDLIPPRVLRFGVRTSW